MYSNMYLHNQFKPNIIDSNTNVFKTNPMSDRIVSKKLHILYKMYSIM